MSNDLLGHSHISFYFPLLIQYSIASKLWFVIFE